MSKNQEQIKVIDLLKSFEFDYFSERGKTPEVLDTWDREYNRVYNHLPLDDLLTEEALKQVILRTEANTRHRRRYVLACVKLADYAELEHDLKRFIGSYSLKSVNPRKVPLDEAIAQTWEQIKNPEWRWVYGMMATYGIRNCEVFRLDLSKFPVVYVDSAKKGRVRLVYPLYSEWVEQFYLASVRLPECTGRNNSEFGQRVTKALRRCGVPFAPYNLRHAWARRSIEFGWDITLAASQMGHSVKVHSEVYHLWLTEDVYKRTYERLLSRPDKPNPPVLLGLSIPANSRKSP